MSAFHDLTMNAITGEAVDFSTFAGKRCLIVNVASRWGLTPQYAGLRTLQEQQGADDFAVLAFPCNQFGAQEPGSDDEILAFARSEYDVNFPLFSKIEVNGDGACELYQMLKSAQPDEAGSADIAWNFTKFLVDGDGNVVARFAPQVTPEEIAAQLAWHYGHQDWSVG